MIRFSMLPALLLLAAGAVHASVANTGLAPDCSLIPGSRQDGEARTFTTEDLFEYMNGNSEGYFIYRFVRMNGVTCKAGDGTYIIDVSEMADPESAYGIFTANRDMREPIEKIGMNGQVLPRRVTFAKGKYYFEIAASPDRDHRGLLRQSARAMEKRIQGSTEPPEMLAWFPSENLVPDSVRLVPESVLGIRILKRGYIGQYEGGRAFLIREETPEAARQVMEKLRERIGQVERAGLGEDSFKARDRYLDGICVFRKGVYIGGFANVKDPGDPAAMAGKLAAKIP